MHQGIKQTKTVRTIHVKKISQYYGNEHSEGFLIIIITRLLLFIYFIGRRVGTLQPTPKMTVIVFILGKHFALNYPTKYN